MLTKLGKIQSYQRTTAYLNGMHDKKAVWEINRLLIVTIGVCKKLRACFDAHFFIRPKECFPTI